MAERKPTVMIIDDSQTIRKTAQMFLGQAGFDVCICEDGFRAVAAVGDVKPDLIFLDVMMPGMDGYAICRLLKDHPAHRDTPVVILSSKGGAYGGARARMSGANGLLAKPFTKQSLIETVQEHCPGLIRPATAA